MAWQLAVIVEEQRVDEVCGRLWAHGTLGVEVRDGANAPLPDLVEVRAAFGHRVAAEESLADVEPEFPAWVVEVADDAGLDAWRPYARVERAGQFLIRPTWIEAVTAQGLTELVIDPLRAFGSGSHASTRLALAALCNVVNPGDLVLDVGTGSGILAIGAAKLGARRVLGIDVDPNCVEVVHANAELNGVADHVTALTVPVWAVDGPMDVVVANILAPVLAELARDLQERVAPGGALVLSGFLAEQEEALLHEFPLLGVVDRLEEAGWCCLVLERSPVMADV